MRTKAAGKALPSVSVPEVEFAYPQLLEPRKEKPSRDGGPARAYPKLSGKQGGICRPGSQSTCHRRRSFRSSFGDGNFAAFHPPMLEIATK
jgi:hypothetical protein